MAPADQHAAIPRKPALATDVLATAPFDAWANPHPWDNVNALTGAITNYAGARIGEDVVLTNVIGFDVKAWDPYAPILDSPAGVPLLPGDPGYITRIGAGVGPANVLGTGAYVDLNYLASLGGPAGAVLPNLGGLPGYTPFCGAGDLQSRVYRTLPVDAASPSRMNSTPPSTTPGRSTTSSTGGRCGLLPAAHSEEVGDEDRDGILTKAPTASTTTTRMASTTSATRDPAALCVRCRASRCGFGPLSRAAARSGK